MKNLKKINLCLTALFAVILFTASNMGELPKFKHDPHDPTKFWMLVEEVGGYIQGICPPGENFSCVVMACVSVGSEEDCYKD